MTKRTTIQLSDNSQTEETYTYDAAGNIVGDGSDCGFVYDTNNRLTSYDGNAVEYDLDGNMTSVVLEDEITDMTYDSANRLTSAGANYYTYNAEDVRIRNLCGSEDTTYTYNTNVKLSQLLMKTTGGVVTKYVYGLGLIGEECGGVFKTYHFDNRGSTVMITDASGKVTDAFRYDTYGRMTEHVGSSDVIFGYNGRDGVVTDKNGLIYMRARYYSPVLRRFVNADVIAGKISNAITLNRYAYANGNPVSNVDPFGLSADRGAIVYEGNTYNIFVPNSLKDLDGWTVVDSIEDDKFETLWNLGLFLAGFAADDLGGVAKGDVHLLSRKQLIKAGWIGLGMGVLNALQDALEGERIYYNITFYQKGDKRRAVIQIGSSSAQKLFDRYADDRPHSLMMENFSFSDAPHISYMVKKWYDQLTGQHSKWKDYDMEVTVDSAHKNSKYSSYLWIDSNGTLMETPMLYENDKVEIGYRHGFLWGEFTPLLSIPLEGSSPAPEEYQNMLAPVLSN